MDRSGLKRHFRALGPCLPGPSGELDLHLTLAFYALGASPGSDLLASWNLLYLDVYVHPSRNWESHQSFHGLIAWSDNIDQSLMRRLFKLLP